MDLDGVLFQDLSFYGPDRLNSRRYLTACELEAQRDREYFKRVLAQSGPNGLQQAMLDSLDRQLKLSPLTVKVRRGPSVTSAAVAPEHAAEFAFLQFPDSPVQPLNGWVRVAGNEASTPQIEVRNRSGKPVRYVEMGWVVSDQAGRQYLAGSLPSSEAESRAASRPVRPRPPGQHAQLLEQRPAREYQQDDRLHQPGGIHRRQSVGAQPAKPRRSPAPENAGSLAGGTAPRPTSTGAKDSRPSSAS